MLHTWVKIYLNIVLIFKLYLNREKSRKMHLKLFIHFEFLFTITCRCFQFLKYLSSKVYLHIEVEQLIGTLTFSSGFPVKDAIVLMQPCFLEVNFLQRLFNIPPWLFHFIIWKFYWNLILFTMVFSVLPISLPSLIINYFLFFL